MAWKGWPDPKAIMRSLMMLVRVGKRDQTQFQVSPVGGLVSLVERAVWFLVERDLLRRGVESRVG